MDSTPKKSPADLYEAITVLKQKHDVPWASRPRRCEKGSFIEGVARWQGRKIWMLAPVRLRTDDGWVKIPGRAYLKPPPEDEPRGCRCHNTFASGEAATA